jgi:phage FluMu protein Com
MTIRYTCSDCQSVLKIKDDKAGTNAKCPKCKTPFVVPQPDEDDGIEVESEAPPVPAAAAPVDDMVDMPIELTPEVSASDDFDPMDVLSGPTSGSPSLDRRSSAPVSPPSRKPSMAEMMKDLEASKKKEAKKSSPDMSRPAASSLQTAGSAADMLSKAYQQKRESASAPPKTAKDAKAAEEREMLTEFIKTRALPAIAIIGCVIAGFWWYSNKPVEIGPPRYDATGIITKGGAPAKGITVFFEPIATSATDDRALYQGTTDENGNFTLSFTAELTGAAAGDYQVSFADAGNASIPHPNGQLKLTVTPGGPNEFKIDL